MAGISVSAGSVYQETLVGRSGVRAGRSVDCPVFLTQWDLCAPVHGDTDSLLCDFTAAGVLEKQEQQCDGGGECGIFSAAENLRRPADSVWYGRYVFSERVWHRQRIYHPDDRDGFPDPVYPAFQCDLLYLLSDFAEQEKLWDRFIFDPLHGLGDGMGICSPEREYLRENFTARMDCSDCGFFRLLLLQHPADVELRSRLL